MALHSQFDEIMERKEKRFKTVFFGDVDVLLFIIFNHNGIKQLVENTFGSSTAYKYMYYPPPPPPPPTHTHTHQI